MRSTVSVWSLRRLGTDLKDKACTSLTEAAGSLQLGRLIMSSQARYFLAACHKVLERQCLPHHYLVF